MIIKEYRIILPMTVEEYQIGQLYTVAEASKGETGGGDGVEIVTNELFNKDLHCPDPPLLNGHPDYVTGQYTYKLYHMSQKLPGFVRVILSPSAMTFAEYAWNAYPYCRTLIKHELLSSFGVSIESFHSSDITLENPHQLDAEELRKLEVVWIDIADISPSDKDYVTEEDPKLFVSQKTGRGPLKPGWWLENYTGPIMCAYKVIKCSFPTPLFGKRIEAMIQRQERRLFQNFHQKVFCSIDIWYGMDLKKIRDLEEETKRELEEQRKKGPARGHKGTE